MTSLSQLRSQKMTVLGGMANTENRISSLEEKISRLRKASGKLGTSVSDLESIKGSITGLTINTGRWKGKEENEFEQHYSSYKESVKQYVSGAGNARDAMDQDIKRYEADKATSITGLNNLENTLNSLDGQIRVAQAKEE